MTCRDIDQLIARFAAGGELPPEAAAHLAACERCRSLAAVMASPVETAAPSTEQLQRIKSEIAANVSPVRPLTATSVIVGILLLIVALAVATGVIVLGVAGWLAESTVQKGIVFGALAGGCGLLAFSLVRLIVPGSRLLLPPRALIVAVLVAMCGIFAILFHPHEESTFVATGLFCLRIGLTCAVPAAVLFWLVLRRGAILNPVLTAVTAGALAGLSGLTLLQIFCPNLNVYHIVVWHFGTVLASVTGGIVVGAVADYLMRRSAGQLSDRRHQM